MRIFLSESEKHVREAVRFLIEQDGRFCITGEADHVESMLAQVCSNPPDLILLDWNMRELRPARIIAALRNLFPEIRIIALGIDVQDKARAISLGFDDFISKVELPEQFLSKLLDTEIDNE